MTSELERRLSEATETMRRIALDVNHALMVLPTPTGAAEKRAWASLIDAKNTVETAIEEAERANRRRALATNPQEMK